jgi:hypothetical protein
LAGEQAKNKLVCRHKKAPPSAFERGEMRFFDVF